ncbi:hypothetical protein CRENBAI_026726 [Crenichthys baileyi]|uniref:Uncharacterized protein n=1 Tax=Crenichthys baileyi TaxID=28760 RepID=A0AAV9S998_9TELE
MLRRSAGLSLPQSAYDGSRLDPSWIHTLQRTFLCHATEGLGDASAPAHATEGLGDASAPAHATEGLCDASAPAHVTEGPADTSGSANSKPDSKSADSKPPGFLPGSKPDTRSVGEQMASSHLLKNYG